MRVQSHEYGGIILDVILVCDICGMMIVGNAGLTEHAMFTGHFDYHNPIHPDKQKTVVHLKTLVDRIH